VFVATAVLLFILQERNLPLLLVRDLAGMQTFIEKYGKLIDSVVGEHHLIGASLDEVSEYTYIA
jgi:hypothetical protein